MQPPPLPALRQGEHRRQQTIGRPQSAQLELLPFVVGWRMVCFQSFHGRDARSFPVGMPVLQILAKKHEHRRLGRPRPLFTKISQQIIELSIEGRSQRAHAGYHERRVLAVHIGAVSGAQHQHGQDNPEPSASRNFCVG
jgi:hypothetical protein